MSSIVGFFLITILFGQQVRTQPLRGEGKSVKRKNCKTV
jgi:hypothetical protein